MRGCKVARGSSGVGSVCSLGALRNSGLSSYDPEWFKSSLFAIGENTKKSSHGILVFMREGEKENLLFQNSCGHGAAMSMMLGTAHRALA